MTTQNSRLLPAHHESSDPLKIMSHWKVADDFMRNLTCFSETKEITDTTELYHTELMFTWDDYILPRAIYYPVVM